MSHIHLVPLKLRPYGAIQICLLLLLLLIPKTMTDQQVMTWISPHIRFLILSIYKFVYDDNIMINKTCTLPTDIDNTIVQNNHYTANIYLNPGSSALSENCTIFGASTNKSLLISTIRCSCYPMLLQHVYHNY